jgi:hypothetical protein
MPIFFSHIYTFAWLAYFLLILLYIRTYTILMERPNCFRSPSPPHLNLMHDWILNFYYWGTCIPLPGSCSNSHCILTWYNTSATSHPIFCIYPPNIYHTQHITVKYVQLCPLLIVFLFLSLYAVVSSVLITFTTTLFCFFILLVLLVSFLISILFLFILNLVQPHHIIKSLSFLSDRPLHHHGSSPFNVFFTSCTQ